MLNETTIKHATPRVKSYKLGDEGGLYLEITPSGGKLWRMKYFFGGKEQKACLGRYPLISLLEAREKRDEIKQLLLAGRNPKAEKYRRLARDSVSIKEQRLFRNLSLELLESERDTITQGHYARSSRLLLKECLPFWGDRDIGDIEPVDVVWILKRLHAKGTRESAKKLYHVLNKTFKWALVSGYISSNPAANIDISILLGKSQSRPYSTLLRDSEIRALLLCIDEYQGETTTKEALRFLAYTAVRSVNVRRAEWREIDFEAKQWIIPASKMKQRKDHIVPLSSSVLTLLENLYPLTSDSPYLFPSLRSRTAPMSENTLLGAIRRLGFSREEFTPHGFRSMFSTLAHERSPFKFEAIELQLSHHVGNSVMQTYNRALYLSERKALLEWWANYLDALKAS